MSQQPGCCRRNKVRKEDNHACSQSCLLLTNEGATRLLRLQPSLEAMTTHIRFLWENVGRLSGSLLQPSPYVPRPRHCSSSSPLQFSFLYFWMYQIFSDCPDLLCFLVALFFPVVLPAELLLIFHIEIVQVEISDPGCSCATSCNSRGTHRTSLESSVYMSLCPDRQAALLR